MITLEGLERPDKNKHDQLQNKHVNDKGPFLQGIFRVHTWIPADCRKLSNFKIFFDVSDGKIYVEGAKKSLENCKQALSRTNYK